MHAGGQGFDSLILHRLYEVRKYISTMYEGIYENVVKKVRSRTFYMVHRYSNTRIKIIDINGKDITKRKPSTYKCLSNLKIGKKSLRAYGGCLGFQRRRRTR